MFEFSALVNPADVYLGHVQCINPYIFVLCINLMILNQNIKSTEIAERQLSICCAIWDVQIVWLQIERT